MRGLALGLAWLGAACAAAAPARAERLDGSSAEQRPAWLTAVPESAGGSLFFVGVKTGVLSLEDGKDGAYRDAAAQVAGFIRARVSGKLLIRRSALETRVVDEIRQSARGELLGARIKDLYWERTSAGGLLRSRGLLDVWALIEFPQAQVERERERLQAADQELGSRLAELCAALAGYLSKTPKADVQVSGFKELVSESRFAFSRLLEDDLRGCLARNRLRVSSGGSADLVVTGDYVQAAGAVPIRARILDAAGATRFSAEVRPGIDALDPAWLQADPEGDAEFFGDARPLAPRAPRTGAVSVKTRPSGARIFVDGVDRGLTPSVVQGLAPGIHSVVLSLKDYVPATQEVAVQAGDKAAVEAALKRETGTLAVRSIPGGAEVSLDGARRGSSPWAAELPTGRYRVSLSLRNYKPWSDMVEIPYGGKISLDPRLSEEDGALFVLIEPPGADIRLDGELIGQSAAARPLKREPVSAGPHTVTAEKPGYKPGEWPIRVRAFQTTSVAHSLAKAPPEPPKPAPRPRTVLESPGEPPAWARWLARLERPDRLLYANVVGGAVGGDFSNVRLLEGAWYGFGSRLGFGTSVVSLFGGGYSTLRTDTRVSGGLPSSTTQPVGVSMISVFPVQLYFAPLAYKYTAFETGLVASMQLYLNMTYWAQPKIDDGVLREDSTQVGVPTGRILDYGIMLHPGALVGVRAGFVETRFPSFSVASSRYAAVNDRRFYVAADLSLGVFIGSD
ncbi:MAG: PEGA domain-containing protein [Elusimicrobia bacterium]|nr:PEGA domain-containing protein [Elusimicrobiota bacterium]